MSTPIRVQTDPSAPPSRPLPVRFALAWLPALGWLGLILWASSDAFSASQTSRFIEPSLRWLFPRLAPVQILEIHALLRKAAHVTEYAILALLFWRALRRVALSNRAARVVGKPAADWRWRPALGALAVAALCAVVDELHQAQVPSRTGSPRDVGLDVCGAALALGLLWAGFSLRRRVPAQASVRM